MKREYRIRLHLTGPGRAKNWAAEQVRQFQFVQELQYTSDITSATSSAFTERRTLDRHRFLLVSAPLEKSFALHWGVTDILESLGSSDDLLPVGRKGYPVGPIEPETLSDQERSKLMNFMRGEKHASDGDNHIIRFISQYEGSTFSLKHRFSGRVRNPSFTKGEGQISGMERDVLLNTPVIPERYIPDRYRRYGTEQADQPLPNQSFSISGIDHYLQPFFPSRLTGEATLRPTAREQNQLTFTGSGSFNIVHPSRSKQIGELRLQHIKFVYDAREDRILDAHLQGRIAISSFPDRHVLNRISFLRKPSFRISYQANHPDKHE
jgi:hypothetical protein